MQKIYFFLVLLLAGTGALTVRAQSTETLISGTITSDGGVPLAGATAFLKGTYTGTGTNEEGVFILKGNFSKGPVVLVVSFVGFETQEISLTAPDNALQIILKPSVMLDAVVVAASRVEENIGQVPVTIDKLDQRRVEQLTTPDVVAGLGRVKSVDISSSSLLISSFSTRGFSSSRSERVLQLADYMDTQLPSLSSNFGNLLGVPILDVESMEILHGPASALYGANAFNGVLLFNSKDPFLKPGLTVRLRGGNRSLFDGQLRYAQKIGDKLAFKISGGYLSADDFIADNQDAANPQASEPNNANALLNYDAVNRYGDVNAFTFGTGPTVPAGLKGKSLFLPGYSERDLLGNDNKAYSIKVAPSISYLLTSSLKLTVDYKFTQANAIYQNNSRYRFKDSGAHQGRVELKGTNWFVRGFSTRDFSGGRDPQTDGGYNLALLGGQLANQIVPTDQLPPGFPAGTTYGRRYIGTYLGVLNARLAGGQSVTDATAAAQTAANTNAPLLQPGTPDFDAARNRLIHNASFNPTTGVAQGSRVVLRSFLNDASGQYTFKNSFADLTVGGAYRQFLLGSDRTVFDEPTLGERITNYEFGGYAQASKNVLDERLRFSGAVRVDNFKNFGTVASPRGSVVYVAGVDKQHNFRASYSRAYRSPTQSDQYIRFDVGRAILLGNVGNGFQGYSTAIRAAAPADLGNSKYLVNVDKLRLEEVNTLEGGYRAQLSKSLFVDANYYFNTYNDFIGTQTILGFTDGTRPTLLDLTGNPATTKVRAISVSSNVAQKVQTQGASLGLGYFVNAGLTVSANYSFNDFITTDLPADFLTFFNTPRHKFNVGIDGQLLERTLSYNVNYRQASNFRYESTFAIGDVGTTQTVDAQLGYTIKAAHTTLQAGVSNLFDASNFQVYGAPSMGRLGYFGLLFDLK